MNRSIIYLRINEFPAAIEELRDSSLRNKPFVVCSRHSPGAPVLSVSEQAKQENIYSGMALKTALKRCRSLTVVHPHEELYKHAGKDILSILKNYSPLVEPGRWGQFFLDMTGTSRLFGAAGDTAFHIRREINERVSLISTLGIGSNKLVSSVAGKIVKSYADLYSVPPGSEASFMAPLKSSILPAVKNPADRKLLYELNIRFVSQIASMPVSRLSAVFGKKATLIFRQALGIDNTPVKPPASKPFVFEEGHLDVDTNDLEILFAVLMKIVTSACYKMRQKKVLAKTVWLHIRHCDGIDVYRRLRLKEPLSNEILVYPRIAELFSSAAERRQRISYISVTFTDFIPPSAQTDLFRDNAHKEKEELLIEAVDRIRSRFGNKIEWAGVAAGLRKSDLLRYQYRLSAKYESPV